MKNFRLVVLTFLASFLLAFVALAQEETETLLGNDKIRISGFGSPFVGFGNLNGEFATFSGGGGGVLINQRFFFGGYGSGLSSQVNFQTNKELDINHGGFWMGYHFNPKKLLHLVASTKIGWGDVQLYDSSFGTRIRTQDNIFVVEPELGAEVNVAKFFKVSLTGAYRVISGANLESVSNQNLNGYAVYLTFKFGWFD